MTRPWLFVILALIAPRAARADADGDAIRATALDYIDGWYDGDAARMERALHPELVKRIVRTDAKSGATWIEAMGATQLVERTRAGGGTKTPKARRGDDVRVLDVFGDAAVARVDAGGWIDYLELHKWKGRWLIVNVLWELKPVAP